MDTEILKTSWHHLGKWPEPALAAELWLEYGKVAQRLFKEKLDAKILFLNGDFFLSKHDVDCFQQEAYEAASERDFDFFSRIQNELEGVVIKLKTEVEHISSLPDFFDSYKLLTGLWMPLNLVASGIERYAQEVNPEVFESVVGFLDEKPWTLQQIDELFVLRKNIENSLGRSFQSFDEIPADCLEEALRHVQKYQWLGSHHFTIHHFTLNELKDRLAQTAAPIAEKRKSVEITEKEHYVINLLNRIGFLRFRAAEMSGYASYYASFILEKKAQQFGLTYNDIVEHTASEIISEQISSETALLRKQNTAFYFDGQERILSIEETKAAAAKLLVFNTHAREIKGLCAHKGKAVGQVKIVTTREEMKDFKEGMILVAYETTPDIIHAMQQSAAIVTDFGGLTCHAAIVARELKKPCVVGTKDATKVLKDGDMVEVDADLGTINIL